MSSLGLDGDYTVFDINEEEFDDSLPKLFELDGFNVTIPYKTKIIPYLDQLDSTAERIGAVNVVQIKNGRKIGYNTDCLGFVRSLAQSDIPLEGKVAIVGIGGVGRMFAIESAIQGCSVALLLRESQWERGADLCREIEKYGVSSRMVPLDNISGEYNILINATPVGMFPNPDNCPIQENSIHLFNNIFDCIYNPLETKLMKYGKELGLSVLGGLPMLVYQAAEAQEIWNNVLFEQPIMDKIIGEIAEKLKNK
jgi:shikimate dehydrogenase